ncbi:hypothetical protein GXM_10065 [Nostoc sphaeroides CCNUC1]|uniref:Uncharacterized protein n=1 Tax=Nostoc sphaeroides CCNUC1 TaxID=2653204 RepID=A0A5P8WJQ4_9NOSO|nr:hypothetical protein GXM_10065 [Nostoc sphaeroides CCNUC1]
MDVAFDKKAVAIGLSLTVGIGSAAMAWKGSQAIAFISAFELPEKIVCQDKNNRPFRMTPLLVTVAVRRNAAPSSA